MQVKINISDNDDSSKGRRRKNRNLHKWAKLQYLNATPTFYGALICMILTMACLFVVPPRLPSTDPNTITSSLSCRHHPCPPPTFLTFTTQHLGSFWGAKYEHGANR